MGGTFKFYFEKSMLKEFFSSNVNEVVRVVLNYLYFFLRKDFARTSTKSTESTKSTKTQPSKSAKTQISE